MDLGLNGRRVLVTGGTRGIGRAVVEGFLAEGAAVGFCARHEARVADVAAELGGAGDVRGYAVDVGDAAALAAWVDRAAADLGGVDAVVANVSALAMDDTEEDWERSLQIDLLHTVRLVRAALPHLKRSDAASIVAVSSVSGRETDFAAGPYGTVKTALAGYVHGLAVQLAPDGVRANCVSPGNVYDTGGVWGEIERTDTELFERAMGLNPTGRMGTPGEIADAVVFVSSARAARVSGTNLVVDGALTRGVQL